MPWVIAMPAYASCMLIICFARDTVSVRSTICASYMYISSCVICSSSHGRRDAWHTSLQHQSRLIKCQQQRSPIQVKTRKIMVWHRIKRYAYHHFHHPFAICMTPSHPSITHSYSHDPPRAISYFTYRLLRNE